MIDTVAQEPLITTVFEASSAALDRLIHLVSDLDRHRTEYALATLLLEETWVVSR